MVRRAIKIYQKEKTGHLPRSGTANYNSRCDNVGPRYIAGALWVIKKKAIFPKCA